MGISFDLFGTLVDAEMPADPAAAVETELLARDVSVPDDWTTIYAQPHIDVPTGTESALSDHVVAALSSRDIDAEQDIVRDAVAAAFDPLVETREGACEALEVAHERGPVAVCSNCSVRGVVSLSLERSALDHERFDAIVSSVECGWRKPAPEIFEETAGRLGTEPSDLVHIGDDPTTDGGIERLGGTAIILDECDSLTEFPQRLEVIR